MSDSNGTNGDIERQANGRFAKGNRGGPGNPQVRRIAALRTAVIASVTPEDMQEVMETLMKKAKAGDMTATQILFDRTLGRPTEPDILEKMDFLEQEFARIMAVDPRPQLRFIRPSHDESAPRHAPE